MENYMSIEEMMKKLMETGLIERYYIRTITATTYDINFYFSFNGKSFCFYMRDFSIEEIPYDTLLNAVVENLHKTIDSFLKNNI